MEHREDKSVEPLNPETRWKGNGGQGKAGASEGAGGGTGAYKVEGGSGEQQRQEARMTEVSVVMGNRGHTC